MIKPRFTIALLSLGGLLAIPGMAAADCMQTAQTQADMTQCAGQQYKAADDRLNQEYKELNTRLQEQPKRRDMLLKAQRRWLAFRDAECRFEASAVAGGSAEPMVHTQCLTRLTQSRNEQLATYLHCQEGDLSCPAPAHDAENHKPKAKPDPKAGQ